MRAFIWLICLFLLPMMTGAVSREPSISQQALELHWQHYLSKSPSSPPAEGFPYTECFRQAAEAHQLPQNLLLAVARGESNFDATARSSANAYGLMQILWPATANDLGIKELTQLLDPCRNVEAGARYLRQLMNRYQGNLHKSLAAYNYGPGRIPARGSIPSGAAWYSDYIRRHLEYVEQQASAKPATSTTGQLSVITFDRAYRASAFVDQLQVFFGDLHLDYFRREDGSFHVRLQYHTQQQRRRGVRKLRELGLSS